mgnify:CR=1 FL=1
MFRIVTDTSANLPTDYLLSEQITIIPYTFQSGKGEQSCMDLTTFDAKEFYAQMRSGVKVTTSQIPPQRYIDAMTPVLAGGEDVLFVGMSSGISGSYASAEMAAQTLRERFPERKIRLVDTLSASLGEGLQAVRAADYRDEGLDVDACYERLMEERHTMCQVFTVDDLKYLRHTGRLSAIKTIIGTVLGIKPLLKGDTEGKIVCFARTRKLSIRELAAQYAEHVVSPETQTIGIAHADCPEDTAFLKSLIEKTLPPREIMTVFYEPVTGSHVGPGTLALFFDGDAGFRGK